MKSLDLFEFGVREVQGRATIAICCAVKDQCKPSGKTCCLPSPCSGIQNEKLHAMF